MPWTPFPDLDRVLAELLSGARDALGESLIGAYLQGSFALGDGDDYSDCDFVVVMRDDVDSGVEERLNGLHSRLHARPETWAQHLEGSYIPAAELRKLIPGRRDPPGYPRAQDWDDPAVSGGGATAYPFLFLGNGERSLVRSQHDNTLVVRQVLREHGITLTGPDPQSLIDPVDPEALKEEIRDVLAFFSDALRRGAVSLDALWIQGFTVLFFVRGLVTLATGDIHSKPAAVRWAAGGGVPARWRPLIEAAFTQRSRYPRGHGAPAAHGALAPAPGDAGRTMDFVRWAMAQI